MGREWEGHTPIRAKRSIYIRRIYLYDLAGGAVYPFLLGYLRWKRVCLEVATKRSIRDAIGGIHAGDQRISSNGLRSNPNPKTKKEKKKSPHQEN